MASGGNKDMLKAAEKVWSMLDHLYENNPAEYKKFVDQQMKEDKEMFTPPEPGFCLRCTVSRSRQPDPSQSLRRVWLARKESVLYINICKWSRVSKPKSDNDSIPVKGGVLRHVIDKQSGKKNKDLLFDVAVNPHVMEECQKEQVLEEMFISLCQDFVEDVAQLQILDRKSTEKISEPFKGPQSDLQYSLDEQWKHLLSTESKLDIGDSILKQISEMKGTSQGEEKWDAKLPSLKLFPDNPRTAPKSAYGETGPAQEKKKAKKMIEELSSQVTATYSSANGSTVCTPEHSVAIKEADDKYQFKRVCVRVTLPGVKSVSEVELNVSKDDLQVIVDSRYSLTLQLPAKVNEDKTKATFSSKHSLLSVTMPCLRHQ